jgi:hypothetical protein
MPWRRPRNVTAPTLTRSSGYCPLDVLRTVTVNLEDKAIQAPAFSSDRLDRALHQEGTNGGCIPRTYLPVLRRNTVHW